MKETHSAGVRGMGKGTRASVHYCRMIAQCVDEQFEHESTKTRSVRAAAYHLQSGLLVTVYILKNIPPNLVPCKLYGR